MALAGMERRYTLHLSQEEATQTNHALKAEIERLMLSDSKGKDEGTQRYLKTLGGVQTELERALNDRS